MPPTRFPSAGDRLRKIHAGGRDRGALSERRDVWAVQGAIRFTPSGGGATTSGCVTVASNGKLQHGKEVRCGQIQESPIPNNRFDGTGAGRLRRRAAPD